MDINYDIYCEFLMRCSAKLPSCCSAENFIDDFINYKRFVYRDISQIDKHVFIKYVIFKTNVDLVLQIGTETCDNILIENPVHYYWNTCLENSFDSIFNKKSIIMEIRRRIN